MRKINLLIALLLCLTGCRTDKKQFTINGKIDNLENDTIVVYSLEGNYKELDTIFVKEGSFTYTQKIDTITPLILLFSDMKELLVYADKGLKVTIKGDIAHPDQLQINGGSLNDELNTFRESIRDLGDSEEQIINKADSFIRNHPFSLVSIQLLDKYFVQEATPDFTRIQALIKSMGGELQDHAYIKELNELANKLEDVAIGKRAPSFSLKNNKDNLISLSSTDYKDKYILLHFWASWCEPCTKENEVIKRINKKFKKEKLEIIGISLDVDKKNWLKSIQSDTLSWEQLSDLKGWDNSVAKQYGIQKLPSNILISPDKNILAKDLDENELTKKLENIFK